MAGAHALADCVGIADPTGSTANRRKAPAVAQDGGIHVVNEPWGIEGCQQTVSSFLPIVSDSYENS